MCAIAFNMLTFMSRNYRAIEESATYHLEVQIGSIKKDSVCVLSGCGEFEMFKKLLKSVLPTITIHFFISSIACFASSSVIKISSTPLPSFRARDKAKEPA